MKTVKLAFLGFGGVARAFVQMLEDKRETLQKTHGFDTKIVAISTNSQGAAFAPDGLNTKALLSTVRGKACLKDIPGGQALSDNDKLIDESGADIFIELSYTNPTDGEPARSYCNRAAGNGMKIITANKGPTAFGMEEILKASPHKEHAFGYEASVMAGTPVISLIKRTLPGADFIKFRGILNGTSNYILGQMEQGTEYAIALKDAQEKGFAEADPTADVEGFDVMMKVIILSSALFEQRIGPNNIARSGISRITKNMVENATKEGKRWKLIGSGILCDDGQYEAKVEAELLSNTDPLYGISGASNALCVTTAELGDVTVSGNGAGLSETAYGLLADLIFACQ
ncbi:MAG: homoserine dehydrogenase [Robiginitomaculum sp.]